MSSLQTFSLVLLRVTLGWMFFYAGITKVLNPEWSAAGYISGANNLQGFFQLLLQPGVLPFVNFLNEWGLTLIGIALILGAFVRLASLGGILMMALYYLVILQFPYPNEHAYIVDEHIIYIAAFLVLFSFNAGRMWGIGRYFKRLGEWAQ